MSNWVAITLDSIKDRKLADLVEALRTVALGDGQSDPTPNIIAAVTERIRMEVGACPQNRLDPDTTKIPHSLLSIGVRMCIREMKSRLEQELTEDERKAWDKDEDYLRRVARCEVIVTSPEDGAPQRPAPSPSTWRPNRQFSQQHQEGL